MATSPRSGHRIEKPLLLRFRAFSGGSIHKQQDIDHVLHAYRFLVDGGRLNAIKSYSTIFRTNKKSIAFRQFLEEHHAFVIENDEKAFKERLKLNPDTYSNMRIIIHYE